MDAAGFHIEVSKRKREVIHSQEIFKEDTRFCRSEVVANQK